jgi:shikimate 5-dehydrogenase/shikimate kinase
MTVEGAVANTARKFDPDASIILVGIRASGKRSLGLIAAAALGWRFVTEDHYFQAMNGMSRQDYLKTYGSEQFHQQDIKTSKRMLDDNKLRCVIDCGLGSLTSSLQDYLRTICQTNPVVFVLRDMDKIKDILGLDERATKLLAHGNTSHRRCSNFEFYNLEDETAIAAAEQDTIDRSSPNYSFKLRQVQTDFSIFARFLTGNQYSANNEISPFCLDRPVESRSFTHALLVPLSAYTEGRVVFTTLESAGDIVEICVDQWPSSLPLLLARLVADIRRTLSLPVLISTQHDVTGMVSIDKHLAVLEQGIRLGVEYISIDMGSPGSAIERLTSMKGRTKLVGTYIHPNTDGRGWKDPAFTNMYRLATSLKLDLIRLLNHPTSRDDNDAVIWFRQQLATLDFVHIPCIAYNLGRLGLNSLVTNAILTSVSHETFSEAQDVPAYLERSPLSSAQIMSALFDSYVLDPLEFFIIGANVSGSLSPAMHNRAYEYLGLKHRYGTKNIKTWTDIHDLAKSETLGGLSVVQPYKVQLVPHMQALTGHAKAIGAVNTMIPLRANPPGQQLTLEAQASLRNRAGPIAGWFGDNTDFVGILNCVKRSLSPRNAIQPKTTTLVVGAGGMARAAVYAMLQIGCKNVFVYNRTVANTRGMAEHFNRQRQGPNGKDAPGPVRVLEALDDPWPTEFAPPTVVVSCVTHERISGNPGSSFEMPEAWLHSQTGGVVVEMAYMSKETPLIKQMKRYRESTRIPWVLVDGIETLIEQAVGQFESMTGRKAPKQQMASAAYATISANRSYLVDNEEFFT